MDMEHKNAVKRLSPLNGKKGCKRHLSRTEPLAVPSILDRMPALQPKGQIRGLSHSRRLAESDGNKNGNMV